ncbi:L,D-transpeptidase family protein [Mongoliibacter ruber]|uniref:Murein L,D-transpeptidase YcbB/YkuD n=1 Tax=Mongoliibacter ruber TaxID=1750599 RepID=A0A2T0WE67_9BACT|nr:L,D-transpeptidase family protein [Mongoliibacter ruber]PRY84992.1 murein L,D-transpeptidase YcbB/YkuD [Mongoliibacter ruber]
MVKNLLVFFLFVLSPGFTSGQQDVATENELGILIRNLIERDSPEEIRQVRGQRLFSSVVINRFYSSREFKSAWSEQGKLLELAYEMRYEIAQAKFDGFNPQDYHLEIINELFDRLEQKSSSLDDPDLVLLSSVDVLLTDAFMMLASHLSMGKVDPEALKTVWNIQRNLPELAFDQRLEEALEEGSLRKTIESFYPSFSIYKKMRDGLRAMYDFKDKEKATSSKAWKTIKIDKSIKLNDTHSSIPEIKKRLNFWGFLDTLDSSGKTYNEKTMEGLKLLQVRHGMEPDGVIGQGTVFALNQTPDDLIAQAAVNLERLRWLPDNIKDSELILVNTANFQLDYIQNRDTLLTSKVIVGRTYHSTPQFSAEMSYLVFSPTWTVPVSITRSEIIPAAKKDPDYFRKKNMKLLTSGGREVDPSSLDWSKVNPREFPYTVRQEPGEQNSLGLVKFMFPNKYSVYIHDTPSRSLFVREDRALSHGCIRIQKPFEFAKLLLSYDSRWTDDRIKSAMRQDKEQTVLLNRKIPVVIFYLTYWADPNGNVFFRRDIYNRDKEIFDALQQERKN